MKKFTILLRVISVAALAAVLSGCGGSASSAPQPTDVPAATAAPAPTDAPTVTAAPPQSAGGFAQFETGLDGLGISYERLPMAAEYVGAVSGFKYKTADFTVELYQFDPESDAYQQASANNAITMEGFGSIPAYVANGFAMYCESGLPQTVLDLFNTL